MRASAANRFRFIQWDITSRCNLACLHCRSTSFYGRADLGRDLPLNQVLARIDELSDAGVRRIHFLGGEPFTRKDLPAIVRHATSRGILCSVNTNGTLITEDTARSVVEAGLFLLTISIDGHDARTNDWIRGRGSFRRAIRGLGNIIGASHVLDQPVRLVCSHTLMRPNCGHIDKMLRLCERLGLDNFIVSGLRRMGGAIDNYERLALSEREKLQSGERLAHTLKNGRRCGVQFEATSVLGKVYLNEKYGVSLPIERCGCDAVTSKSFVQPDGTLFPCQDVAKTTRGRSERELIRSQGVQAWDSPENRVIGHSADSLGVYANYVPCRDCPAFGGLCVPCPLAALRGGRKVQATCSSVMALAKKQRINLEEGVRKALRKDRGSRLLQSPSYRTAALWSEYPIGIRSNQAASDVRSLRTRLLLEIRGLLVAGAESVAASERWIESGQERVVDDVIVTDA